MLKSSMKKILTLPSRGDIILWQKFELYPAVLVAFVVAQFQLLSFVAKPCSDALSMLVWFLLAILHIFTPYRFKETENS